MSDGRCRSKSGADDGFLSHAIQLHARDVAKLIQNPEDRRDAARAYAEQLGGALHGFWYGFGEHDGYAIFEAPDNVSMAGGAIAIAAGGALTGIETTVLMTVEDTLEAVANAKQVHYRRPGESTS